MTRDEIIVALGLLIAGGIQAYATLYGLYLFFWR